MSRMHSLPLLCWLVVLQASLSRGQRPQLLLLLRFHWHWLQLPNFRGGVLRASERHRIITKKYNLQQQRLQELILHIHILPTTQPQYNNTFAPIVWPITFIIIKLLLMQEAPLIPIQSIYDIVNHNVGHGISGYYVDKKYFDPLRQIQQRQFLKIKKGEKDRKRVLKRGNFLDDETNMRKIVPGPGKYKVQEQWGSLANKLKIKYPNKETFLDEIIKYQKKEKRPAPGTYNVVKSLKALQKQKKALASRKIPHQDRISYLDNVQYESSLSPGPGNYNPRERVKTEYSQLNTKPEVWRKKHQEELKKKSPKSPDMITYKPVPSDYTLFQNLKPSTSKRDYLGKTQRFKTEASGSGLNPAKYNIIQQWGSKQMKKVNRHGLEVLSTKKTYKSVYYN